MCFLGGFLCQGRERERERSAEERGSSDGDGGVELLFVDNYDVFSARRR